MRSGVKWPLALGLLAAVGCKKEVDVRVQEVPAPPASWAPVRSLTDWRQVILSTASTGNALLLQHPYFFTRLTGQHRSAQVSSAARLPTDISVRLALAPDFFAYPFSDTLLAFVTPTDPLRPVFFNLRQLDPAAQRLQTRYLTSFKCTAINRNNVLLASYENTAPGRPLTLLLATVRPGTTPLAVTARRVTIPLTAAQSEAYVRHIAAVDNYFLLDLSDAGLYKINENGTASRVYGPATVDAFYKWRGTVYAHAEWNQVLTSTDDGNTWQHHFGAPDIFNSARFYPVGDSLVGNRNGQLYTLHWHGTNYRTRPLKTDGLGGSQLTGLEVLGDSVYAATPGGLFARSRAAFFETKK